MQKALSTSCTARASYSLLAGAGAKSFWIFFFRKRTFLAPPGLVRAEPGLRAAPSLLGGRRLVVVRHVVMHMGGMVAVMVARGRQRPLGEAGDQQCGKKQAGHDRLRGRVGQRAGLAARISQPGTS